MLENTDPVLTNILLFRDAFLDRACSAQIINAVTEDFLSTMQTQ